MLTGFQIPFAEYVRNIHVDSNYHFFFDSVETPCMWKASITSSSVTFPEDSFLHEGFHHENEPGSSGLGKCFSRPYFLKFIISCCCCRCIYCYCYYDYLFIYIYFIFSFYICQLCVTVERNQQPVPMLLKTCITQIGGHP